ncbi:hypothetical protein DICSQDRAFT_125702 [Dichomitus squalens LYAD-421 SS1]|uniref:uncharacterized protein n=1 Tax=Dichomitus squalens (strain LYAD-421) TaxID=732165 RepID=UPI0004411AC1|nr:uncharacterized protein DICSQDRAFT_125702 [Dichomitus squalens LYAD-421 SS1]EJF63174.1 hypothetical protein DICSQDRAFT_125702 [Dichomitus squalens LYAD-421 SS1]
MSLTLTTSASSFPVNSPGEIISAVFEKDILQATLVGDQVCDPFATPTSDFNWADDVEDEFYSDDASEADLDTDEAGARSCSFDVDRFFASDACMFGQYGHYLTTILEEDEDEEEDDNEDDENHEEDDEDDNEEHEDEDEKEEDGRSAATDPTDSTGNGSLLQRIFLTNRPKVASKPSLDDIEEEEDGSENDTDETGSSVDSPDSDSERTESDSDTIDFDATNWDDTASTICDLDFNHHDAHFEFMANHFDSLEFSLASISTVDEDERQCAEGDPDSGWVWVEFEDDEQERQLSAPSRSGKTWGLDWRQLLRRLFIF